MHTKFGILPFLSILILIASILNPNIPILMLPYIYDMRFRLLTPIIILLDIFIVCLPYIRHYIMAN